MAPRMNILGRLSVFLGMSPDEILRIADTMSTRYKIYHKPKKSGGTRTILHPCRELKALQYAVSELLLNDFYVHPNAYAYIPGMKSPLRMSAEAHVKHSYTIRIDFKDFFPSIQPDDLIYVVEKKYHLSKSDYNLLEKILFYKGKLNPAGPPYLPIGAPTSPTVSNMIMVELDEKLTALSKNVDQDSSISRYADDLYFSTDEKGLCKHFHQAVQSLLEETDSPRLSINTKKTLYLSRGTKRVINGLFVTPDGKLSIGRKRKLKIKTMIYKHSTEGLSDDEVRQAQGLLAFIQDCEPEFYNRLAQKYGKDFYSVKDAKFSDNSSI